MTAVLRSVAMTIALVACGDQTVPPDAELEPDPPQPFFSAPSVYSALTDPAALAVGDINGDGRPDLIVVGGQVPGSAAVLLGDGTGAFAPAQSYAAGGIPAAVTTVDFDGNGRDDIAITDVDGDVVLVARSNAEGGLESWTSHQIGSWSLSIKAADLNADGNADLVVASYLQHRVSVLLGDGSGGFSAAQFAPAGRFPISVGIADLDRDGILDLAVADQGPLFGNSTAAVVHGNGDGTFASPSMFEVGNFPDSIAVGDLDGDGHWDLIVANEGGTTSVLRATDAGEFAEQRQLPMTGSTVLLADLDGDGKPELIVADGDLLVLHNAGDGTFDTRWTVPCGCGRLVVADFNGDDKLDLAGLDVVQRGASWTIRSNDVVVLLHR